MTVYPSSFEFQGMTYKCLARDEQVEEFLDDLDYWRTNNASTLLSFREEFRRIIRLRPIRGLVWCAVQRDAPTRTIAIWLLGQIRHPSAISVVSSFGCDPNRRVRKEVAKALRRMGAWKQLRDFADDIDPAVKWIATERSAKPFRQRLARYLHDDVQPFSVSTRRPTIKYSLKHQKFSGCPPKSSTYIRQILMRIRFLVRYQKRPVLFGWPQWLKSSRIRSLKARLRQRNGRR
jgi:hypothetical protein